MPLIDLASSTCCAVRRSWLLNQFVFVGILHVPSAYVPHPNRRITPAITSPSTNFGSHILNYSPSAIDWTSSVQAVRPHIEVGAWLWAPRAGGIILVRLGTFSKFPSRLALPAVDVMKAGKMVRGRLTGFEFKGCAISGSWLPSKPREMFDVAAVLVRFAGGIGPKARLQLFYHYEAVLDVANEVEFLRYITNCCNVGEQ
ncbi:hypothetical protein DFH08DRAFT_817258 [Mycena albidolilacea]|uniref:Uncharacterized protein n=1 Tax=Mycena albidolilacea TaxID=1033008 RepID=A0AAD6ZJ62_9AGAR|nr:hypothetical protein DFH08DRAFT_817258 [Mycena albidolilacea]